MTRFTIGESFRVWWQFRYIILVLSVVSGIPHAIFQWVWIPIYGGSIFDPEGTPIWESKGVSSIIDMLAPMYRIAGLYAVFPLAAAGTRQVGRALWGGFRYYFAVLGCSMIQGLCLLFGLALLIVPGLISAARLYPMVAVYIYERPTGTALISRTAAVTKGKFGLIWVGMLAFSLAALLGFAAFFVAAFFVCEALGADEEAFDHLYPLFWVLTQVLLSLFTAFSFVIYREHVRGELPLPVSELPDEDD